MTGKAQHSFLYTACIKPRIHTDKSLKDSKCPLLRVKSTHSSQTAGCCHLEGYVKVSENASELQAFLETQ